jgi:hypothetical protein
MKLPESLSSKKQTSGSRYSIFARYGGNMAPLQLNIPVFSSIKSRILQHQFRKPTRHTLSSLLLDLTGQVIGWGVCGFDPFQQGNSPLAQLDSCWHSSLD